MIQVNALSRHYGEFKAVDSVSFEIGKGEIVGLLGHNGAGKTTIMKMITGYLEPTSGSVLVDGQDLQEHIRSVQQRIGYLPENCPVWPDMTVIDYLEYQAVLHGVSPASLQSAVATVIRKTALQEKAVSPIGTLSRGYCQRVGVAQALIHDPDIIILDEPTNGLDPTQIKQMRSLVRELSENATVILSTHILQEVQAVCDRVLIMRGGRLVKDARLEELQAGKRIELSLDSDSAHGYLRAIDGVHSVNCVGGQKEDGAFTYSLEAAPQSAPAIAEAVHQAGHRLFLLQPEHKTLETVFAEINQSETGKDMEVSHG